METVMTEPDTNSTIVTDLLPDGSLRPIGTGEMMAEILEARDRPVMKRWLAEQKRMDALYPLRRAGAFTVPACIRAAAIEDADAPEWRPDAKGARS
jgi:hypothetical protein